MPEAVASGDIEYRIKLNHGLTVKCKITSAIHKLLST